MNSQNEAAERTLRLVWPQWQGAGRANISALLPEVPLERARYGYVYGARVLQAILPEHEGPTELVPVGASDDEGSTDGVESRGAILRSMGAARDAIARHDPDRILTLGGECAVSVAPFASLAAKYGEDLAIIWIDSHPDVDTPATGYDGFHAMAVSALLGHGDPQILDLLPATVEASHVALAGLHDWEEDAYANVAEWGLRTFSPDDLRDSTGPLLDWLAATGASKVAIHFDVDTVDSDDAALGLGQVPGGLTRVQARRVVDDLGAAADVVGLTIAEFIPRTALVVADLVEGMPLIPRTDPAIGEV